MGRGIAILCLVAGAVVCAVPLGLLPDVASALPTSPRVLLGLGAILILLGLLQLARDHRAGEVMGSFALLGLAVVTGWVTFFAPEGTVARVLPFIPTEVNEALTRLLFGVGAAACVGMAVLGLRRLFR